VRGPPKRRYPTAALHGVTSEDLGLKNKSNSLQERTKGLFHSRTLDMYAAGTGFESLWFGVTYGGGGRVENYCHWLYNEGMSLDIVCNDRYLRSPEATVASPETVRLLLRSFSYNLKQDGGCA
jgi:hypothetical protein